MTYQTIECLFYSKQTYEKAANIETYFEPINKSKVFRIELMHEY